MTFIISRFCSGVTKPTCRTNWTFIISRFCSGVKKPTCRTHLTFNISRFCSGVKKPTCRTFFLSFQCFVVVTPLMSCLKSSIYALPGGAVVALCISTERAFILWHVLALQHITESYNFDPLHPRPTILSKCSQYIEALRLQGAQWLIGRVLDSRPRGRGFEPHRRHCVVVLKQDTFI